MSLPYRTLVNKKANTLKSIIEMKLLMALWSVFSLSLSSFNQLDLPAYESYEKLRHMLLLAIQECSEGFGLA